MDFPADPSAQFLTVSSALCGFTETELLRTGMTSVYWAALVEKVGVGICGDFLAACAAAYAAASTEEDLPDSLQARVLNDAQCGPLARNLISLWYLGQWNALPRDWCDAYGCMMTEGTQILSSEAYKQGLVWPAFGGHPQGAKPTGWGSWAFPPLNAAEVLQHANA
jgi:hypothetical protein